MREHIVLNLILAIISGLSGVGFTAHGLWALWAALDSNGWPSVPGTIVASDVLRTTDSDGVTERAALVYKYSVGGTEYTGKRVYFGAGEWSDALGLVERYPRGATVRIHHDPSKPQRSVIEPGFHAAQLGALLLGVLCLGVGATLMPFEPGGWLSWAHGWADKIRALLEAA